MTTIGLAYLGLSFRIRTADAAALGWLQEFLRPQFADAEGADVEITFEADTGRYARWHARGPHPGGARRAAFALDTRLVEVAAWGEDTWFDPNYDVLYRVDGRGVTVLTAEPNRLRARVALMRVVREFVLNRLERGGALLVHGAAIRLGGRGVAVAGPKRAGKTSTLTYALHAPHAGFIANDRAAVHETDGALHVRGIPTVVTVRRSGLAFFPDVQARLSASTYHDVLTMEEARRGVLGPARPNAEGRYTLSPAQWCVLLDAKPVAGERLDAVVFPRVTPDATGIEVERLAPDAAEASLREGLFRTGETRKSGDLFVAPGTGDALLPAPDPVRRVAETVACFRCRLGPDAFANPGSFRDLTLGLGVGPP